MEYSWNMIVNHICDRAWFFDGVKSLATTGTKYLNVGIMSYRRQTNANKKAIYCCPWLIEWTFNERVLAFYYRCENGADAEKGNTARSRSALTTPERWARGREAPLVQKFRLPLNSLSTCFRRRAPSYSGRHARRLSSAGFSSARNF